MALEILMVFFLNSPSCVKNEHADKALQDLNAPAWDLLPYKTDVNH